MVGPQESTGTHEVLVVNRGQARATVTVQERDFVGGADGSLVFQERAPYSASEWVAVSPTTFDLGPGTSQVVRAAVAVPPAPEPGDHQVALVFLVEAGVTEANVRVNRGVATPIYITVSGPAHDFSTITDLAAPGFVLDGPVRLSAKVHDEGTVHRDFRGPTALRVSASGESATFPDFTVLRGGTRDISTDWEPPLFCVCYPSVTVTNANGVTRTVQAQVVVVPLHLIGVVLGALLVLWLAYRLARRRYRAAVATAAARVNESGDA
ncbi:hypothetical protein Acsp05_29210 [Actinokineospora sp. NBRC 105648]|nr:hypothetical protein Acsp05_29210 [Actinokineospora sp. NBRC 105648]